MANDVSRLNDLKNLPAGALHKFAEQLVGAGMLPAEAILAANRLRNANVDREIDPKLKVSLTEAMRNAKKTNNFNPSVAAIAAARANETNSRFGEATEGALKYLRDSGVMDASEYNALSPTARSVANVAGAAGLGGAFGLAMRPIQAARGAGALMRGTPSSDVASAQNLARTVLKNDVIPMAGSEAIASTLEQNNPSAGGVAAATRALGPLAFIGASKGRTAFAKKSSPDVIEAAIRRTERTGLSPESVAPNTSGVDLPTYLLKHNVGPMNIEQRVAELARIGKSANRVAKGDVSNEALQNMIVGNTDKIKGMVPETNPELSAHLSKKAGELLEQKAGVKSAKYNDISNKADELISTATQQHDAAMQVISKKAADLIEQKAKGVIGGLKANAGGTKEFSDDLLKLAGNIQSKVTAEYDLLGDVTKLGNVKNEPLFAGYERVFGTRKAGAMPPDRTNPFLQRAKGEMDAVMFANEAKVASDSNVDAFSLAMGTKRKVAPESLGAGESSIGDLLTTRKWLSREYGKASPSERMTITQLRQAIDDAVAQSPKVAEQLNTANAANVDKMSLLGDNSILAKAIRQKDPSEYLNNHIKDVFTGKAAPDTAGNLSKLIENYGEGTNLQKSFGDALRSVMADASVKPGMQTKDLSSNLKATQSVATNARPFARALGVEDEVLDGIAREFTGTAAKHTSEVEVLNKIVNNPSEAIRTLAPSQLPQGIAHDVRQLNAYAAQHDAKISALSNLRNNPEATFTNAMSGTPVKAKEAQYALEQVSAAEPKFKPVIDEGINADIVASDIAHESALRRLNENPESVFKEIVSSQPRQAEELLKHIRTVEATNPTFGGTLPQGVSGTTDPLAFKGMIDEGVQNAFWKKYENAGGFDHGGAMRDLGTDHPILGILDPNVSDKIRRASAAQSELENSFRLANGAADRNNAANNLGMLAAGGAMASGGATGMAARAGAWGANKLENLGLNKTLHDISNYMLVNPEYYANAVKANPNYANSTFANRARGVGVSGPMNALGITNDNAEPTGGYEPLPIRSQDWGDVAVEEQPILVEEQPVSSTELKRADQNWN